jgi:hypothetical protein
MMTLVTRALYSFMVAVTVMLAVPISQLRMVTVRTACCCPDPDNCHCPDHGKHTPGKTSIKACHKNSEITTSAAAPELIPPLRVAIEMPPLRVAEIAIPLGQPHEPPSPERPSGPS